MPNDSNNKAIAKGQTVTVTGKVIAASEKTDANVAVETANGHRLHVNNADVTITADAPAEKPAPAADAKK